MATKKQKRAAALAKREQWLEERRESGLRAQMQDHERRKHKLRESQKEKHDKEHSWKVLDKKCVLCMDRFEEARRQRAAMETMEVTDSGG